MSDDEDWGETGEQVQKLSLGDGLESVEDLSALLKKAEANPDPDVLCEVAKAYHGDDDQANAKKYFEQAIAKDPNHQESLLQLAAYAVEAKETDKAVDLFKKAKGFTQAGKVLAAQGDFKNAVALFEEAVKQDGSDYTARANVIQCYDSLDDDAAREKARADFHAAFGAGQLNPAYKQIGRFMCAQFDEGDKTIKAFDYSVPAGDKKVKYEFQVYKKGEVHDAKILSTITLGEADGKFVLEKDGNAVESFDAAPAFKDVRKAALGCA